MNTDNPVHYDIEATPLDADDRLCIEVFDADGNMVTRQYGPNSKELKQAHDDRKCDLWCGYCYEEACAYLTSQEPVQ